MSLYLISENEKYLSYWRESLAHTNTKISSDFDELDSQDIVVVCYKKYTKKMVKSCKVIVLDNEPTYEKCISLMKDGVKAYGNVYMHRSHIESAIESLKDGKVWIYPDYLGQMLFSSTVNVEDEFEEKTSDLTFREREVVKLILNGFTNKEIAMKLSISTNTIKVHTKNIYAKLGVTDRLTLFSYLK